MFVCLPLTRALVFIRCKCTGIMFNYIEVAAVVVAMLYQIVIEGNAGSGGRLVGRKHKHFTRQLTNKPNWLWERMVKWFWILLFARDMAQLWLDDLLGDCLPPSTLFIMAQWGRSGTLPCTLPSPLGHCVPGRHSSLFILTAAHRTIWSMPEKMAVMMIMIIYWLASNEAARAHH